MWRAVVRMRCGEYAAAEAQLDEVIRASGHERSDLGLATYYLAYCRAKRGDKPGAEAAFAAAEKQTWQDFTPTGVVRVARKEAEAAIAGR